MLLDCMHVRRSSCITSVGLRCLLGCIITLVGDRGHVLLENQFCEECKVQSGGRTLSDERVLSDTGAGELSISLYGRVDMLTHV